MAIRPMMTGMFGSCDITSTPEDDHDKGGEEEDDVWKQQVFRSSWRNTALMV
jgi:hypothetical protein